VSDESDIKNGKEVAVVAARAEAMLCRLFLYRQLKDCSSKGIITIVGAQIMSLVNRERKQCIGSKSI